jgi:predicted DNA-binding transcriptional regulator AlpA
MNPVQHRRYVRTAAAADYIGSTQSTLEKWRVFGTGPRFCKCGRSVVYDLEDLDAWLTARRRTSTSDTGPLAASGAQ